MTEVKICGITNKDDALCAARNGAAALGFIFYPPSPRYITPAHAKQIIFSLPQEVVTVGVFVNEKSEMIKKVMERCGLDMIQLHGDEPPEFCREFPASMILKALELKSDNDVNRALDYEVAAVLVDSRHAGLYGGTGKTSNWDLAVRLQNKKPLILSGGLNTENVIDALKKVAPAGLDINSGVEESPRKKDQQKLAYLFNVIRAADTKPEHSPLIFQKRRL